MKRLFSDNSKQEKSYSSKRRYLLEFTVGELVFLRVSLMKGVLWFGKRGKLAQGSLGTQGFGRDSNFQHIVWYFHRISQEFVLSFISLCFKNTFMTLHIEKDMFRFIQALNAITHEDMWLDQNLLYIELLVAIIDKKVSCLRSKDIVLVKVLWKSLCGKETTWQSKKSCGKSNQD